MKFYLLLTFICVPFALSAQTTLAQRNIFLTTEVRLGHTFEGIYGVLYPNDEEYYMDEEESAKASGMYGIRVITGRYFDPHFSVGVGAGIEGNSGYINSTSPFFLDLRLHLFNDDEYGYEEHVEGFFYTDFGILHSWNSKFEKGHIFEIGGGISIMGFTASIGYNYRRIKDGRINHLNVNSAVASVGYLF